MYVTWWNGHGVNFEAHLSGQLAAFGALMLLDVSSDL